MMPDPSDRRASLVEATDASCGLLVEVRRAWGELERQALGGPDAAERTELARLLGKVEATLCTEVARGSARSAVPPSGARTAADPPFRLALRLPLTTRPARARAPVGDLVWFGRESPWKTPSPDAGTRGPGVRRRWDMAPATLQGAEGTAASPAMEDPGARTGEERTGEERTTDEWSPGPEELASVRTTVARLKAAFPSVDADTVEATVWAAYHSFGRARVRKYVPILAERRSRTALAAAASRCTPDAVGDGP
ncbi:MarR family winged helix-turn-helix transcriptional regulator [Streptomyces venezuelae]|uniref:three-helix bundle dimerization domain-containing protein n=1 Tax=Streptomyces venezuelae TaxID=54571 RepID=UPI00168A21A4